MAIEQTGSIIGRPATGSDTDTITLSQLPKVTTLAATDRNGTGAAVTYATLVDAMTAALGLTGIEEALNHIIG